MTERSLNRRSFLKGSGSVLLSRALPVGAAIPFSLVTTTPAKAWVQFVYLGIAILSFTGVFGKKRSNGDALRFAALDAKLNVVLDNQVLILESIRDLNENLTQIERTDKAHHRDERYLDRLVESENVLNNLTGLAKELDSLDRNNWDQHFYNRYRSLAFRTNDLISGFESDLTHTQTDTKGVTSIMYASTIAFMISESLRKLGLMEIRFPASIQRQGWVPPIFFQGIANRFSNALTLLIDDRYSEAHAEQLANAKSALERAGEGSWGIYRDAALSKNGKFAKSLCFGPKKWKEIKSSGIIFRNQPSIKKLARGKIEIETQRLLFPPVEKTIDGVTATTQEEALILLGYELSKFSEVHWQRDNTGTIQTVPPGKKPLVKAGGTDITKNCGVIAESETPAKVANATFKAWVNELYAYSQATILRLGLEETKVGLAEIITAHKDTIQGRLVPELFKVWEARQPVPTPVTPGM